MLFKAHLRWPKGTADKAISREGGIWNGATWYDFTTYYATLPAEKIGLELEIEADRMTGALFEPQEVEAERTVIISERQGAENDPLFLLGEEVMAAAFRVHPYGHETLGHMCDLLRMTRDDLYRHYRTYYVPNNALAVAAGTLRWRGCWTLSVGTSGRFPRATSPTGTGRWSRRNGGSGGWWWREKARRPTSPSSSTPRPRPMRTSTRWWCWTRSSAVPAG